jgi:transposase
MGEIITVGLDVAKSVFQVHAVDAEGRVVVRRQVRRLQLVKFFAGLSPCLIGMEACATAHYWARQLNALGHEVRLMPPAYVKPAEETARTVLFLAADDAGFVTGSTLSVNGGQYMA